VTHNATLRLDETLHRRVRLAAAAQQKTRTAFIREAVAAHVARAAEQNALLGLMLEYVNDEPSRG
jgi:predicted transcriptional regulator